MRNLSNLDERSLPALPISNGEEDGRAHADFARGLCELGPSTTMIASIQFHFMEPQILSAVSKLMLGGSLVLGAGIAIGNA